PGARDAARSIPRRSAQSSARKVARLISPPPSYRKSRRAQPSQRAGKASIHRIAVITGSRAEFGLLEPVLAAIRDQPGLQPHLIVTGMHLLRRFGRTIDQIRDAGWTVAATVPMQRENHTADDEPHALARGITGLAAAIEKIDARATLVLGDRIEAFAGACATAT